MTFRLTSLTIFGIFNLIAAIYSLIAFFTTYPIIASLYFFISLPLSLYFMYAKPSKVLDTKLTDIEIPKNFSLGKSPF